MLSKIACLETSNVDSLNVFICARFTCIKVGDIALISSGFDKIDKLGETKLKYNGYIFLNLLTALLAGGLSQLI